MRIGYFPYGPAHLLTQWPNADPALGAEFVQTVPNGRRWVIRMLAARYNCSGVAGNRNPSVRFRDPAGNVVFYFAANLALTAGTATKLQWSVWGFNWPAQLFSGITYHYLQIPPLILDAGSIIDSITTARDANDQWNMSGVNGGVWIEEYLINTP